MFFLLYHMLYFECSKHDASLICDPCLNTTMEPFLVKVWQKHLQWYSWNTCLCHRIWSATKFGAAPVAKVFLCVSAVLFLMKWFQMFCYIPILYACSIRKCCFSGFWAGIIHPESEGSRLSGLRDRPPGGGDELWQQPGRRLLETSRRKDTIQRLEVKMSTL